VTQAEMDSLLSEWQGILRLRDWGITATIVPVVEFADADEADIEPHIQRREATARISEGCPDPELSLVHELLHIWTRSLAEDSTNELIEEHAIEAISNALIRFKRAALGRETLGREAA